MEDILATTTAKREGYWSVACIGRGRWFWVLFEARTIHEDVDPLASCEARSEEQAREQLRDAARGLDVTLRDYGHGYKFSSLARQWRKVLTARRRQQKPARGQGVADMGFVYRHYCFVPEYPEDGPPHWVTYRHRILRRTAKRLYVASQAERLDPDDVLSPPIDYERGGVRLVKTVILDRQRLEAGELVSHPRFWYSGDFTLDQNPPGDDGRRLPADCPPELADSLRTLGLAWPCTGEDVTAAYRKRSLEQHPDRGGTVEAMQAVNAAHERLKHLFGVK
jgi:hypothetical protein